MHGKLQTLNDELLRWHFEHDQWSLDYIDADLDRAVEHALGGVRIGNTVKFPDGTWCSGLYAPSTSWFNGAALVEQFIDRVEKTEPQLWKATSAGYTGFGDTILRAAMRAIIQRHGGFKL